MMQGPVPIVHVRCPVGENDGHIRGGVDAKCEVYVRPLIFAQLIFTRSGGRAGDGGSRDPLVTVGKFQETGAYAGAFFRSKYRHATGSDVLHFSAKASPGQSACE